MAVTFQGTYTKNKGLQPAAGTVAITPDGGETATEDLDGTGSYSTSQTGTSFTIVETITGDSATTRTTTVKVLDGKTVETSRDIGRVGAPAAESTEIGNPAAHQAHVSVTSAQNATAAAVDLTTSEALANALKVSYNAAQVDVAAVIAGLNALIDSLIAAGLMASS